MVSQFLPAGWPRDTGLVVVFAIASVLAHATEVTHSNQSVKVSLHSFLFLGSPLTPSKKKYF